MQLFLIGPGNKRGGGAVVSFQYLLKELDDQNIKFKTLQTYKNKGTFGKVVDMVKHFFLLIFKSDHDTVISLHGSNKGVSIYAILLNLVTVFSKASLIIRVFGGNHMEYIEGTNKVFRYFLLNSYKKNVLMLQTKVLVKSFKNTYDLENVVWFPTSRPKITNHSLKNYVSDPLQLLYLGHLKKEKGINDLLKIARKAETQKLGIRIRLFGELKERYFLNEFSKIGSDKLEYGGVIEKEQVIKEMDASDLLVFPSIYKAEGYPGVLIEAINMNLPMIATDHNYNSELIRDGVDGRLYEPGKTIALWDIIIALTKSPPQILEYRQNLRSKNRKFYSEYWNGEFFLNLINKVNRN